MRDIKFRAWDKLKKRIITSIELKDYTMDWFEYNGDLTFMQFTGLLDKNGKEIYEGDIVKIGKDLIEEVKWITGEKWLAKECPVIGWVNFSNIYTQPIEVIGNIYENSELLT